MSAHVLLNLLKELGKSVKMQGLQSILSLFPNETNKCNIAGAGMLDSFYHMTFKLLKSYIFGMNTALFCHLLCNIKMDNIMLRY